MEKKTGRVRDGCVCWCIERVLARINIKRARARARARTSASAARARRAPNSQTTHRLSPPSGVAAMAADVASWRAAVTVSLTERCVVEPPAEAPPPVEAPEEPCVADQPPLPPPPLRFAPPTPEALAAADAPAPRPKSRHGTRARRLRATARLTAEPHAARLPCCPPRSPSPLLCRSPWRWWTWRAARCDAAAAACRRARQAARPAGV